MWYLHIVDIFTYKLASNLHFFREKNNTQSDDEESDHSNKAVRKTPEIESGHKVSEEVK